MLKIANTVLCWLALCDTSHTAPKSELWLPPERKDQTPCPGRIPERRSGAFWLGLLESCLGVSSTSSRKGDASVLSASKKYMFWCHWAHSTVILPDILLACVTHKKETVRSYNKSFKTVIGKRIQQSSEGARYTTTQSNVWQSYDTRTLEAEWAVVTFLILLGLGKQVWITFKRLLKRHQKEWTELSPKPVLKL